MGVTRASRSNPTLHGVKRGQIRGRQPDSADYSELFPSTTHTGAFHHRVNVRAAIMTKPNLCRDCLMGHYEPPMRTGNRNVPAKRRDREMHRRRSYNCGLLFTKSSPWPVPGPIGAAGLKLRSTRSWARPGLLT